MTFRGRDPIKSKIVISNKIIEQINTYNYLECSLSYAKQKDVATRLLIFLQIKGLINQVLKLYKVQKQTTLRAYNTVAVSTVLWKLGTK
jgi:hypothetical protein